MAKKNFKNSNSKETRKPNNTNQKSKQKKTRFTPVTYKKMLGNFPMVLDELKCLSEDIADIFDGCTTLDDANKALINYVGTHCPDLETKSYIHTSLSLGVNRASLKTENAY